MGENATERIPPSWASLCTWIQSVSAVCRWLTAWSTDHNLKLLSVSPVAKSKPSPLNTTQQRLASWPTQYLYKHKLLITTGNTNYHCICYWNIHLYRLSYYQHTLFVIVIHFITIYSYKYYKIGTFFTIAKKLFYTSLKKLCFAHTIFLICLCVSAFHQTIRDCTVLISFGTAALRHKFKTFFKI